MTENERLARLEERSENSDERLAHVESKMEKVLGTMNMVKGAAALLSILWTISTYYLSVLAARGH